ncbi:dienelactone hydrolase family protein [Verrucomicrobiales bacterium]|nr:dienelactone hydrolase family protein [Verrucomicrobiales bacterium]
MSDDSKEHRLSSVTQALLRQAFLPAFDNPSLNAGKSACMTLLTLALAVAPALGCSQDSARFPGTAPLKDLPADLSGRIMEGAHAFVEAEIKTSTTTHPTSLNGNPDHKRQLTEKRKQLSQLLGIVDERVSPRLEFFSDSAPGFDGKPPSSLVAKTVEFEVHQVRWDVLEGFGAEGLYIIPLGDFEKVNDAPLMVLLPDAADTPEDIVGLARQLPPAQQIGLRFALTGFRILIPGVINRELYEGPNGDGTRIIKSRQTHREWIYRQAFQMGRHPIGYEIQIALSAAEAFHSQFPGSKVTVAGYGSGGRAALYAAAVSDTFDHAFVSGAFQSRASAWSEPIDHNLFGLLPKFSDAAVAAMIFPRPLLVEHTTFPEFQSKKGNIETPIYADVTNELGKAARHLGKISQPSNFLSNEANKGARGDYPSVAGFLQAVGLSLEVDRVAPLALLFDERSGFDSSHRHERIFKQTEDHIQKILDESEALRRETVLYDLDPALRPGKWSTNKSHDTLSPLALFNQQEKWRTRFQNEIIGEFDETLLPLNPRSRLVAETDQWTAWDILLDVYPEFEAWGLLVIPKGIPTGEKRPVVVCQHGRNGLPRDTLDADKTAYNNFTAKLAEQGFITFAPHNLYRGEDQYRWLDRKANLIGGSLFSFITASHQQVIRFLKTIDSVDEKKIAFYGLSYGGESAMRIPALLPDYCLSICSGDFNQWTRKVADPEYPNSFMKSIEWEMPYWNMGNTFDYSEMAALIFPRPFFVERGHHDGVATDEWVAHEYAKVRWLYSQYGLSDQTEIEYFQGGHSINGETTFEFLEKHLRGE